MEPLELVKSIAAAEIAFQIERPARHERKLIGQFLHQQCDLRAGSVQSHDRMAKDVKVKAKDHWIAAPDELAITYLLPEVLQSLV